MNYIQYMKPGGNFWVLPNGQEDVSWSEFWNNWKQAIEKAKDQIIDKWENLKQDYKDAADPIAASERRQAESIEATRAKQASMKFVSDNRTDYEKKRDKKNLELKEFEQKRQQNKEATDAVMWTLTGPVYAVQHLASPNGVVKTYGNTKAAVQNGGGPYIEKAAASAAGDVLDASIVGVPLWNAARPYAVGLYNTTNYSSLGNRLAHPIESLRFAKINTKLSDLVRRAYPEETAKLMLEEASPLFKTVRYYNKGTSGPQYIGGTDIPLQIEGLRNTPSTTVKMWDRAHEYGHLFDDALRRLDTGMARGSFGLSKEGISLVPKNYIYSPGVGINTPRGQMEFMADNIASSLYPEPKYVGMLHGEVAPYLERQALAAQVPFGSMYVQNGRAHVPYFLPEYKNFGRFIPTSTQRGSLGKGYKLNAQDGHSILLDTEIKPQTIPTKTSLAFFERQPSKISEAERLGIPKGIKYYTQEENLAFRDQINNFAKKYGYEPIGDEVTDPEVLERYARSLIKRHNTFYRGVELNPKEPNLSLEHMATHAPGGGAGELYITPYQSVAAMYGEPVEILRPYKLGADRTRWFDEGDFQIYTAGGRRDMHLWEDKKGIAAPWLRSEEFAGKTSWAYKPHVETELTGRNQQFIPMSVQYRHNGVYSQPVYRVGSLAVPNTPFYKSGGSIHIKKKNRGKFTDYCGGKVTEECIRKGKNSSNPTTRKRANFAANARKWKHEEGGKINYLNYFQHE